MPWFNSGEDALWKIRPPERITDSISEWCPCSDNANSFVYNIISSLKNCAHYFLEMSACSFQVSPLLRNLCSEMFNFLPVFKTPLYHLSLKTRTKANHKNHCRTLLPLPRLAQQQGFLLIPDVGCLEMYSVPVYLFVVSYNRLYTRPFGKEELLVFH